MARIRLLPGLAKPLMLRVPTSVKVGKVKDPSSATLQRRTGTK